MAAVAAKTSLFQQGSASKKAGDVRSWISPGLYFSHANRALKEGVN